MSNSIASHLRRAVVLVAATVMMTLGLAVPAGATAAKLTVNPYIPGYRNVSVDGVWTMTQAQAQGLINNGYKVVFRLWGDDPVSDDLLVGPITLTAPPGGLSATPLGLEFHRGWTPRSSQLNEDDSFLDRHDELYAGVRLVNSAGATVRSMETNRVGGYF